MFHGGLDMLVLGCASAFGVACGGLLVIRFLRKARPEANPVPEVRQTTPVHWVKVDASWFPKGVYHPSPYEEIYGPVVEFWPDGQLKSLYQYHEGAPSEAHNRLDLELGVAEGSVTSVHVHGEYRQGVECLLVEVEGDSMTEQNGLDWSEWVRKWIQQIAGSAQVTALPESAAKPQEHARK